MRVCVCVCVVWVGRWVWVGVCVCVFVCVCGGASAVLAVLHGRNLYIIVKLLINIFN